MTTDHYIEDRNLSVAWGRALMRVSAKGRSEVCPLIVSITGFDELGRPEENTTIRASLDSMLDRDGLSSVHTVANTIFPESLWTASAGRLKLFERYSRILPKLRSSSRANARGLYFERMISGGPPGSENQLDFALSEYESRGGVRRSALQIGVFDPARDHSRAAQLGFPCLQHVALAPTEGSLNINAFYATQYMVERAYGNYLGLCRLGRFAAHELRLKLGRMTCFTGIAMLDRTKQSIRTLIQHIEAVVGAEPPTDG